MISAFCGRCGHYSIVPPKISADNVKKRPLYWLSFIAFSSAPNIHILWKEARGNRVQIDASIRFCLVVETQTEQTRIKGIRWFPILIKLMSESGITFKLYPTSDLSRVIFLLYLRSHWEVSRNLCFQQIKQSVKCTELKFSALCDYKTCDGEDHGDFISGVHSGALK